MAEWNLNHYLKACWRWAWLIVLVTVVAAGISLLVSRVLPPVYRASTTILTGEDSTNPNVTIENQIASQRLASSYGAMVKRQAVLEPALKALGLQVDWRLVADSVLAVPIANSSLLEIRVTDSDPVRAAGLANEIVRQIILQSPTITNQQQLQSHQAFTQTQLDALQANIQSAEAAIKEKQAALDSETSARTILDQQDQIKGLQTKVTDWRAQYANLLQQMPTRATNTITVIETAVPPLQPTSPNILFNVLLAAFSGLLLALGSVFLIEYLGAGKIRTDADAERVVGTPTLGAIANMGKTMESSKQKLPSSDPHSSMAEACRVIRTNVRFAWGAPEPMIILVTSPNIGEGKSTICANLAVSFAQSGKQTVLMDADLRRPTLHQLLGVGAADGLSSLLSSPDFQGMREGSSLRGRNSQLSARIAEVLIETNIPNLSFLPAGPTVATSPGELLTSPNLVHVIRLLRDSADVIILDSPPVLAAADTAILGGLDEGLGIVLVAESNKTTARALGLAFETLSRTGARVLGSVVNRSASVSSPYQTYAAAAQDSPPSDRLAVGLMRRGS